MRYFRVQPPTPQAACGRFSLSEVLFATQQIRIDPHAYERLLAKLLSICYQLLIERIDRVATKIDSFRATPMEAQAKFRRTNAQFCSKLVAETPKSAQNCLFRTFGSR
jgi:hypothetical protein